MNLRLDQLPINLFDVTLIAVLIAGLARGRKHGMSQELINMLKWITVLVVCAFVYEPGGQYFKGFTSMFGMLSCYLLAYAGAAGVIVFFFAAVKRASGGKLIGSDVFGPAEYYLGMGSGMVRFLCVLIFVLAMLNSRYYSPTEVKAMQKFQDDVYGSNFFPTLQTVQATVFERSLTGSWIKKNLSFLLIKPTAPENTDLHQKEASVPRSRDPSRHSGQLRFVRRATFKISAGSAQPAMLAGTMAGMFSSDDRERVRAASDIVDVIGSYLPLKRAGANFTALCPFHKEKTPSFNVNPQRQIFHCFGCHKGGDVFTFVQEYESVDFPEALRRLADRAKIPLTEHHGAGDGQSRHLKESLLLINEQIAQRWQSALANEAGGQVARDYLAKRGVPDDAVQLFRLGAAPDLWDDTVNWATSKGHDLALVEKAGLILRKEGSDRYYDRFRGRLMFPICDEQGRVIGFSGRILSGDEKTAKYVNSPETPIFTKSKVFFGLDKSKRPILDEGYAIVCEGQLDLIACFMAGVQNIVAPQGTAFTGDHGRILKRYAEEVVLCFDSDKAGQDAAVRSLDSLLASGLAVRVAVVPAPHDPDTFIKASGVLAFKQLIANADGYFDFYLKRLCATNEVATDKGRLAVLREMAQAVHKTGNSVLIDKYAQKTALRLGVTPDAVRLEFRKLGRVRTAPVESESEVAEETPPAQPPSPPEFWLLKLLLLHEDLVPWAVTHLDENWIQHPMVREIAAHRLVAETHQTWQGVAVFLEEFKAAEVRTLITQATTDQRPLPNPAQQIADITLRLRNQFIDRELMSLIQQGNQPEITEADGIALLRRQQELRVLKRQPLGPRAAPGSSDA